MRSRHRNNKESSCKVQVYGPRNSNHSTRRPGTLKAALAPALGLALFIALLAAATNGGWLGNAAAAEGGITIGADKPVYHPGDKIGLSIIVDSGGRGLTGDLVIRSYPPTSLTAADAFSRPPLAEASIKKDFSVTGQAGISHQVPAADLKLGAGGYPVRVSLVKDGVELLVGNTWLAVVDPGAREPVDLVLLWAAGSPPERNARGEFESLALVERCRAEARAPDSLLQHQSVQQRFPKVKTTYTIEPAMLDQLQVLAGGFDFREGGSVKNFSDSSAEARAAAACLDGFKTLAGSANTEILSSPYAYVELPLLARQGWADGNGQFRVGHDVLVEALSLPAVPRGTYAPGLSITTDSLRYLAATGGEYFVLKGSDRPSVQGRAPATGAAYRLRDLSGERITGLFANDDVSLALFGEAPDPAAFFAALANAYANATDRLVIAAAATPLPPLTAAQRDVVYASLETEPWVRSLTLAEARQKYNPSTEPSTLLKYVDPLTGYLAETYFRKLEAAHEPYEDYRTAVDPDEPEVLRLSKKMYLAESYYWAGGGVGPEEANRGLAYLEDVKKFTRQEFGHLIIKVDTPWVQGAESGEATVTVANDNLYAFTVDIVLSGDGIRFPEWTDQRLRLETGKVEFRVPYVSGGWSRIEARVESRGHALAEDGAMVRPMTGRVWAVMIFVLAALFGGIAYIVVVAKRG